MATEVANINIYELSYVLAIMEIIAIVRMMKVEKSNINILFSSILLDYILSEFHTGRTPHCLFLGLGKEAVALFIGGLFPL